MREFIFCIEFVRIKLKKSIIDGKSPVLDKSDYFTLDLYQMKPLKMIHWQWAATTEKKSSLIPLIAFFLNSRSVKIRYIIGRIVSKLSTTFCRTIKKNYSSCKRWVDRDDWDGDKCSCFIFFCSPRKNNPGATFLSSSAKMQSLMLLLSYHAIQLANTQKKKIRFDVKGTGQNPNE